MFLDTFSCFAAVLSHNMIFFISFGEKYFKLNVFRLMIRANCWVEPVLALSSLRTDPLCAAMCAAMCAGSDVLT